MQNLLEDVSILTTIPENTLRRLARKEMYCICNDLSEALLKGEKEVVLDLGFGTLTINVDNEDIKYRFQPNMVLDRSIKKVCTDKTNPLVELVEETLASRITNTYKDLL